MDVMMCDDDNVQPNHYTARDVENCNHLNNHNISK